MSDFQEIKKRIFKEQKIRLVLELLDCWSIKTEQHGKLYVAGLPDGDNDRSVQVKNTETLTSHIRSKGIDGDIFHVITYILYQADTVQKHKDALAKAKYWICEQLDYKEYIDEFYKVTSDQYIEKPSYNDWLKKIRKEAPKERVTNCSVDVDIEKDYGIIPYKLWYEEGLSLSTQKYFQVGIDVRSERITFAIHNSKGELIGVKGRYCGKNKEIEDRYKYIYLIPCNKSIEFFNFHRALPHIKENKEVIIVEGAKSVMFLHQWGFKNAISIEGDSLSDEQIHLLRSLELDTKYIFAWDKDKDVEFVHNEISKLKARKRFAIYDKDDLLKGKDSPVDKGIAVWEKLHEHHQYKIN